MEMELAMTVPIWVMAIPQCDCNGTLVIQPGAVFSVTGNFNDAFVIGRDSGSGTVIQNGGTFTFNPATNSICGWARRAKPATRSAYDMNGGLLDMSGNTLGIALNGSNSGCLDNRGGEPGQWCHYQC